MRSGAWIRRLRTIRGMKQEHLAELLDISQPTLSRLERGLLPPAGQQIGKLEQHLLRPSQSADTILARLINSSTSRVHLIDDRTHHLLAASPARWSEWQLDPPEALGKSLLLHASPEIEAAERSLNSIGWFDDVVAEMEFATGANCDPEVPISAGMVRWERLLLADGRAVRLTTSLPA